MEISVITVRVRGSTYTHYVTKSRVLNVTAGYHQAL